MKRVFFLATIATAAAVFAGDTSTETIPMTHRMMELAIQVGVILFAARLGNLLFTKLRLPSVLGELSAGILIGPYALGKLVPGWMFTLFPGSPVGVSPELYGLCTVASIVLLFLVGAETDLKMFMRYSAVGSLVGLGGAVVSYFTGAAVAVLMWDKGWTDPAAILMGVMSTATSVSITARILSERRKLDSQEGVTILAGAVIDDVLGIIMLAIGMGMIAAGQSGGSVSWGNIGFIAFKSFGIWLAATIFGVLVARKVARLLRPCGSHGEVAVLTLGVALLVGGCFEKASLAMIIGAYVTGLAFSRTEMGIMIQEKLHSLYQFLVPIFFVVMGMMVNVGEFADPQVLIIGMVYTAVSVLAKIVGCGAPTLLFGFTPVGALRVGLGMVPRGEVALIIAGIAAAAGHQEVLGVAVLMTLLTTLVAPMLLVPAFNLKARGHRKIADAEAAPIASYTFPNHTVTNEVVAKIVQNLTREGFFVHQVNPSEGLYQARREDVVLTFTEGDCEVAFSAAPRSAAFVKIVMAESLAEFESVLAALRKPIETHAHLEIGKEEAASARKGHRTSRNAVLARHIRSNAVVHRLKATDRDGVIRELLQHMKSLGRLNDLERAEAETLQREAIMPTGVGYGVACPHARTDAVEQLTCVIGITDRPIDFSDEEEGRGIRIVLLTLTPDTVNSPYMTFITAALTALRSEERRNAILAAGDGATIRKLLIAP